MLILLLGTVASILVTQQRYSIRSQVERRGLAIAESLAATSKAALATYNYIALEQSANEAAKNPDIVLIIIHDKEGRVAGYSGRSDLQGKFLEDVVTRKILSSTQPMVQEEFWKPGKVQVLDTAVPVFLPGSEFRWGTIRVILSLEAMYHQIRLTQLIILAIGVVGLLLGIVGSNFVARRITQPLASLVQASLDAAQGNLEQNIRVRTGDEVEVLATNFSSMIREILNQRRQLESQLMEIRHLQRYTEQLLTTMNDGLLSIDKEKTVATINPAARRLLGIESGVEKGAPAAEILHQAPSLLDYLEEMFDGDEGTGQREVYIEKAGEHRAILVGCSLLTDIEGGFQEVIANLHDITDLKRLEARIRQSERLAALGTLAAGMAHEIRNPLSAIKTFVQLLPRKLEKPGFLEKFNRTVPRELDRINRLVNDLLELSRDPRYRFDRVDVRPLLEQSVELFEADLSFNNIQCQMDLPADLPAVRADADQLIKAFHNLFRNAIQAMASGGGLTVEASRAEGTFSESSASTGQGEWLYISFQDTGPGIGPEELTQIFNPFYTTKDMGTGLGLSITHKVITEHGGHIEVESSVGNGTRFTVCLPLFKEISRKPFL